MLRRMAELEADALAMPAGRKSPALDHRHLVRHVGVRRIMGDRVDAGLRHYFSRPVLLRHNGSSKRRLTYPRFGKRRSTCARSGLRGRGHSTIPMRVATYN